MRAWILFGINFFVMDKGSFIFAPPKKIIVFIIFVSTSIEVITTLTASSMRLLSFIAIKCGVGLGLNKIFKQVI